MGEKHAGPAGSRSDDNWSAAVTENSDALTLRQAKAELRTLYGKD